MFWPETYNLRRDKAIGHVASALAAVERQTWEKAIKTIEDRLICELPKQYGAGCENCDGILEPEACQCSGAESLAKMFRSHLETVKKEGI